MTNEDAIKKIEYRIAIDGFDGKDVEDLEMAIQALKESNAIRNKVIDEFAELLTEILTSWAEIDRMAFGLHNNNNNNYSYLTEAKAYDRVVALIDEMAEDMKGD